MDMAHQGAASWQLYRGRSETIDPPHLLLCSCQLQCISPLDLESKLIDCSGAMSVQVFLSDSNYVSIDELFANFWMVGF